MAEWVKAAENTTLLAHWFSELGLGGGLGKGGSAAARDKPEAKPVSPGSKLWLWTRMAVPELVEAFC